MREITIGQTVTLMKESGSKGKNMGRGFLPNQMVRAIRVLGNSRKGRERECRHMRMVVGMREVLWMIRDMGWGD